MYEAIAFAMYQLGINTRVHLMGALSSKETRNYFLKADIYLQPSVSEGFCNAVLEAQSSGIPVVCTDAGGLPENVCSGLSGFVVQRRNPAQMADALEELIINPELRNKMGIEGRNRVMEFFNIQHQIQKFSTAYEAVDIASKV